MILGHINSVLLIYFDSLQFTGTSFIQRC